MYALEYHTNACACGFFYILCDFYDELDYYFSCQHINQTKNKTTRDSVIPTTITIKQSRASFDTLCRLIMTILLASMAL